ncbi:MAG: Aspartate aminotransferase [Alphaproteobacteria bacterium MarineAlpha5_Bin8]|nr:MAG: Aspartate aminotransferase [Alphaproteobacteria bacterium MarineAlpha5_Bin7]PPR45547.1 MAG: Aspartate aminotransferase [Alphaproteobacteria bacterium MarineAlpha5_Bin8]PPR52905.1 MAG: Aspartate aminotransferase [Alphaproteobacteria bacterium MarineAlpha5_Bin6]|tara:strand:- start:121 stop:1278 length:1158 start_codon:yes stop_codon:yes gene_type:complete
MKVSKRIFNLETETAFTVLAKANKLKLEGKDIINLGIGQPDFPTPLNIVEAGIKALKDGHHGYTPSNGIIELREAVSKEIYRAYKENISPENILITPGGKPVIFFATLIFGDSDKEIIYPDPGFPIYRSMIKYSGAKPVPMNLKEENNFEIDIDELSRLINDNTSLIIINNPNNPTGSFMNEQKIIDLVNLLEKYSHVTILSDEIYSNIIFDKNTMPSLLKFESIRNRLIVLEGWSKTFCMTGWRLGWSFWPNKLIDIANKLCVNDHSCPTSISQYAGIEALEGPKDEIHKIKNEFEKRRNFVHEELNKLPNINCFKPGGAFYAFPNVSKSNLTGKEYADIALEKHGVAIVPGTSFGDDAKEFIRISYANSIENIEKAIKRLSNI